METSIQVLDAPPAASSGPPEPFRAGLLAGLALAVVLAAFAPEIREVGAAVREAATSDAASETPPEDEAVHVAKLEARLERLAPRGPYLVVSTSDNRIRLVGPDGAEHEGVCSTGSYVRLEGADGRSWTFETPRGAFRVLKKTVNPVWVKPDWAFVEAGQPVPPPGAPERYERGVLGRYSLALGDGYLIHGTLYQRMLGMPVTHGCVRLGDEDLERVYRTLRVGSPVYIY